MSPALNTEKTEKPEVILVEPGRIPLVPLRGLPVFPGMVFHFDIGREKSIIAVEQAMEDDGILFLAEQKDFEVEDPKPEEIYEYGCYATVKQMLRMPENLMRVLVEIDARGKITSFEQTEPCFIVNAEPVMTHLDMTKENRALLKMLKSVFTEYIGRTHKLSEGIIPAVNEIEPPELLIDIIAANMDLETESAQELLAEQDVSKRLFMLYELITGELEYLRIEQSIDEKVKNELDRNQREFVLREQIRVIQDELGDDDDSVLNGYYRRLEEIDPSPEVRKKVEAEIARLKKVPMGSSESAIIETYLDWVLDLPWNTVDEVNVDVAQARLILNEDHYALDKVKERILEYLSVLKLSNSLKSPIICLVGPPGVGKTSIAKSIARALGRKYVRLSLGGMRDEAEIRGHRRTYLGAIPGRIIYHLKMAGTRNPLFLLDEIDKMSQDFKGDPGAALLEVLDPEQNNTFTDNYLELPFDLSDVLFLTTANSLSTIPEPLMDRMEIIEVNGYVESEKMEIAKRYLIPQCLETHGLKKEQVTISENALRDIITYYTRESGVRELKRKIAQVMRIAAREIVENNKKHITVNRGNLDKFLGMKRFLFDLADSDSHVGLVTGLAWTSVGGETLQIEVVTVPGKGKIQITGQLGDVMQESVKAAISYIRSQTKMLKINPDFYEKTDIHLHVPEGAVPKDGPSAGITIATALISALTGQPVPDDLAMTGEITLRGRVLPIGGLREKLAAASRAGIKTILIPEENRKDLEEVPDAILKSLKITPVAKMSDVAGLIFDIDKDESDSEKNISASKEVSESKEDRNNSGTESDNPVQTADQNGQNTAGEK